MRAIRLALPLVLFASAACAQAGFQSCLSGLRADAAAKGVSGATFDRAMAGVEPDMKVIEAMNNQPEFKTPIWDYLGTLVDDEKVAEGRNMLRQYASVFAAAEQRFGVDRHTIAAVWGVESDFGKARGKWPLVQSLATGACLAPRRNAFFKGELIATLQIIQRGDVRPDRLFGSWAGAFGHTQFIPSTYLRLAVDGDAGCPVPPSLQSARIEGGGIADQFPGRLAGPVGADRLAHPRPGGGKEPAGLCFRRGRGCLGRLLAGDRRRRDLRRSHTGV